MTTRYELVEWENLGYNLPQSLPYPRAKTIAEVFRRKNSNPFHFSFGVPRTEPANNRLITSAKGIATLKRSSRHQLPNCRLPELSRSWDDQ
jgi:hypothetical protein